MKHTIYLLSLLSCFGVKPALAQQDPQLSMYTYNPLYYNPAAAGLEGVTRIQLTQRTQYLGYQTIGNNDPDAAQNSQVLSVNVPLTKISSGIGIYVLNDRAAQISRQAIQLSYAYRIPIKDGTLSLGVQGGLYNLGVDFGQLRPGEPGDPAIPTGKLNNAQPDLGVGVYYNTVDYWLGVSMTHINEAAFRLGPSQSSSPLTRQVYLTAGYQLGIGYDIDLQPSVLVQYDTFSEGKGAVVSANVLATYANNIWAGLGYRFSDGIVATAGINMGRRNAFRLGGAVDIITSARGGKSFTSYEILVGYALPAPSSRKKPIIRTPRFRY